jgi:heat shock protein HtpX
MTQPLDNYQQMNADWRKQLRDNNRKSIFIMCLFVGIYCCLGLLIDMYIVSNTYRHADLSQLFMALITLQHFPLATFIMLGVAVISLFVTFSFYDKLMLLGTEYREINPTTAQNTAEQQLYNVVEEMKIASSLPFMPKVFIIEADYMNAFASGYSDKSAMVAITRGLMVKLTRSELQAVMAHELSHVKHLDIKVTLMASVLANLIVMVLDLFFYNIIFSNERSNSDNKSRNGLALAIIILRYLLPIINIVLLMYLSRTREYLADAGCVELLRDNKPLASALLKIENDHLENKDVYTQEYNKTPHENVRREAYIYDPTQAGFGASDSLSDMFSTHPKLKDRLAAIGFIKKN